MPEDLASKSSVTPSSSRTCPHGNPAGACSWCDLRDDGGLPEARRCTCVTCSICGGLGSIDLPSRDAIDGYALEPCEDCTHGIVEECDYCMEQRELDADR